MNYIPYTRQAVIGWDNVFSRGEISASSETTDGPADNAVDGLTYDWWEGDGETSGDRLRVDLDEAASVDYLAIAAHTLGSTGATIQLERSVDGSVWVDATEVFSPSEDKPYLWRFDSVGPYAHWRVRVVGGPARLGVLQAGQIMVLPEGIYVGHKPANLNRRPEILNNKSERGQLLGRSVLRVSAGAQIAQGYVEPEWVRETWAPFALWAESHPFFFAWRHDTYPEEVLYAWTEDGADVEQGHQRYMKVTLDVVGQV